MKNVVFAEKKEIENKLKSLIGPDESVIVALSGGADSMLTAILVYNFWVTNKYPLQNLIFVHFNHKIRPESDQEEEFVKTFFHGIRLICISKPTKLKNIKEEYLRAWRYGELQKLCKKYAVNHVVLGHHLSDRIESTFLNLLRGAGINGFLSMSFVQSHPLLPGIQVIRPLITLGKSAVLEICKKNRIPYVSDPSNLDEKTSLRNRLRNTLLPALYELAGSHGQKNFEASMLHVYAELEQQKNVYNVELKSMKTSKFWKAKFAYEWDVLQKNITVEMLVELLKKLGIYKNVSTAFLEEMKRFLSTAESGYKYFQKTYFFVAHGKIYIIQAPQHFRTKLPHGAFPKKGARYKGKTWNQYCIAQKIPVFWRNFIPVLEKEGKIVKVIKPF